MDFLATWFHALLGFFTQRMAMRQAAVCRPVVDRSALRADTPPSNRDGGFGWTNVESVYEPRRAGPTWSGVPSVLDNRATRRGG
jgi:hypothetical protein